MVYNRKDRLLVREPKTRLVACRRIPIESALDMNQPALLGAIGLLQSSLVRVRRNVRRVVRRSGHNSEDLHQLRVSARKCRAVLGPLKKQLPRRRRLWWKQTLQFILRTTGAARDLDVLDGGEPQTHAAKLEHVLQKQRNKARRSIAKTLSNLSPKKLERRIGSLSFDGTMSKMAFTVGRIEGPPEIHVADIDGRNDRQLTRVH